MPTVFKKEGFRFFFYSNEGNEPAHVHVIGKDGQMKVWVPSMQIEFSVDLSPADQRKAMSLIFENLELILEKWNEFTSAKKKNRT